MTNDENKLIADVLRNRVNEIKKMFQEPGVIVDDIPRAMNIQVMILAQELEHAFYQHDPAFKENVFVGAVQDEMKRNVTAPTGYTLGWASGLGVPRR
jgi:hypothetical protein